MAAEDGQYTIERQPAKRGGKHFRIKVLESIGRQKMYGLRSNAALKKIEEAWIDDMVKRAFIGIDDEKADDQLFREIIRKAFPDQKAVMPDFEFDLPRGLTPLQKAEAIFQAISTGHIPPDVGKLLIDAAKTVVDIQAVTDFEDRIKALEEKARESRTQ